MGLQWDELETSSRWVSRMGCLDMCFIDQPNMGTGNFDGFSMVIVEWIDQRTWETFCLMDHEGNEHFGSILSGFWTSWGNSAELHTNISATKMDVVWFWCTQWFYINLDLFVSGFGDDWSFTCHMGAMGSMASGKAWSCWFLMRPGMARTSQTCRPCGHNHHS